MTPSSTPSSQSQAFDPARLDDFLRAQLPGLQGEMALQAIGGGQSNPTFFVSYGSRHMVLRKKPAGEVLPSAHAVDREYRVMKALAGTALPVPQMLLYHADSDVVGTPFYLMERLEGRVFHDTALPGLSPDERRAMYFAMAETLAALHGFDWQAAGLADFGKPGNYYARQLRRWGGQWRETKTRDIPAIDRVLDVLEHERVGAGLLHGERGGGRGSRAAPAGRPRPA